jgi:hypothetical protein
MPTIYSTENGQVVRASDMLGSYYYLADSLGTPTEGAWIREDDAIAFLNGDESAPAPTLEIDEQGYRLVDCAYCGCQVRASDSVPPADDDEAWEEAAKGHDEDCEWVETRAHRVAAKPAQIELYAPQVEDGNIQRVDQNVEYEFYGDFDTIEQAIEAAESCGCGIWLTSTEDDGRYTGRIFVRSGEKAYYESI